MAGDIAAAVFAEIQRIANPDGSFAFNGRAFAARLQITTKQVYGALGYTLVVSGAVAREGQGVYRLTGIPYVAGGTTEAGIAHRREVYQARKAREAHLHELKVRPP